MPQYMLPPLNSRENVNIIVHTAEGHRRLAPAQRPDSISLRLKVEDMFYAGDITSDKMFHGFSLLQDIEVLPSISVKEIINPLYVPFSLDNSFYKETRLFSSEEFSGASHLETEEVLFERLSRFLQELMADPTNTGQANLIIEKWSVLSEEEAEEGLAWYEAHEKEYVKAINTSRAGSCSVCLEDLNGELRSTECSHVFHKECIYGWLKTSRTCPLCRYPVIELRKKPTLSQQHQQQQRRASGLTQIFQVTMAKVMSLFLTCFS